MSSHFNDYPKDISTAVSTALTERIANAKVTVTGRGGHFSIEVVAPVFEGLGMLESQRLVLRSIAHLMAGENAPVHAVDTIVTRAK